MHRRHTDVVVQFYPWFKFYFSLFCGMVMYDNKFKTKETKIQTYGKIEPQHTHVHIKQYYYYPTKLFLCREVLKGFFPNFSILVHCKQ